MNTRVNNIRIKGFNPLITPDELKQKLPLPSSSAEKITEWRHDITKILGREDNRLMVVVGPCSIHAPDQAIDYADKLLRLSKIVEDELMIIMRVYFEKPRTTTGWKGLINDPHLEGSFNVEEGLASARTLLIDLANIGLPTGTEALDPIVPQYIQELVSWTAIGARTSESQTHREMASGLSTPVGFKNATNGDISIAINAMISASRPHSFLGINQQGMVSVVNTTGNPNSHIVLRGGSNKTNFDTTSVTECEQALIKTNVPANIMIDASHANSNKDPANQSEVVEDICQQIANGNNSITGVMIESNIEWGAQPLQQPLAYGVSITDACIDWKTTEKLLTQTAKTLAPSLKKRQAVTS